MLFTAANTNIMYQCILQIAIVQTTLHLSHICEAI